ncbi:PAQR family membrane homeostasis protein TrhA [Streptomyces sp. MI02-7b]|uniref:PAQR family membrane homeostasis protein TrhA n=1 Tax=Streptomyces sp. MI02-7b TaxID=462941 RepID=UPI0029A1045D|nr:hemolysin III family protein [Streptomyces sp. MI02-7b]MDX3075444.1 hemolysin III family protein [Streptomyces sp. MI02-7b]
MCADDAQRHQPHRDFTARAWPAGKASGRITEGRPRDFDQAEAAPYGIAGAASQVGDVVEAVAEAMEPLKPKLRGWLHAGMFPVALIAGVALICLARTSAAALACGVFSASAWLLFGVSAVYHRGTWGRRGEAVLRRLDHANIFMIIAGTYTPLAMILLPQHKRTVMLGLVWTGALAGVAFRVLWVEAPRWLYTPCYLALGWSAAFLLPDFLHVGGVAVASLLVAGGLLYTAGAVVYGMKRPDPSPRWFGFHEVFHAFTLAAFTTHYAAIALTVMCS